MKFIVSFPLSSFLAMLSMVASGTAEPTASSLWAEYKKDPARHPNIPDCSYAGYERGEKPLPKAPVVSNVKEAGAKGDGVTDDTEAFLAAIAKASGKGAVAIPAGTYKLSRHLVLSDKTVLRGEGPGKTVLDFTKPLNETIGRQLIGANSEWSWTGGMIWIGPADTFDAAGKIAVHQPDLMQGWETWRTGAELAKVSGDARRGDTAITVSNPTSLKPGQLVVMTWENPSDASLLKHVAGHPTMDKYNWSGASWILPPNYRQWQWPVEIKAVSGSKIQLAQPLRIDIQPGWSVALREAGSHVRLAGIEDLRIQLHAPRDHEHLKNSGWNGILFNRAYNCWATNVRITNAENPLLIAASKNCTVNGVVIDGEALNHHSIAMRVATHDCLVENFTIDGMRKVKHGINIEWLSSGNVYSKGRMTKGTFDSHRGLSFDLIRTEIELRNDADGPGGGAGAGPFIGPRVAHWNIKVDGSGARDNKNAPGDWIFMPRTFPMGAFVGITGCEPNMKEVSTAPGEKGSVVADSGKKPSIENLYHAELENRLGRRR